MAADGLFFFGVVGGFGLLMLVGVLLHLVNVFFGRVVFDVYYEVPIRFRGGGGK